MAGLDIHLCPETGICSVIKEDGKKVDMMPNEVQQLREAAGDREKIKAVLAEVDAGFGAALVGDELDQIATELK